MCVRNEYLTCDVKLFTCYYALSRTFLAKMYFHAKPGFCGSVQETRKSLFFFSSPCAVGGKNVPLDF